METKGVERSHTIIRLFCGMSMTAWPDGSISICYKAAKAATLAAKAVAGARAKGLRQSPAVHEDGQICIRMIPPGPCDHVR